jgi:hypothetical protein
MPAQDVGRRTLRFPALAGADCTEAPSGDDVVEVAEHVLQGTDLLEEQVCLGLGVEREEEFAGVAQSLERLAHLVALLEGQRRQAGAAIGDPLPLPFYRRGSETSERSAEAVGIFNRVRPKRQVELQRRP